MSSYDFESDIAYCDLYNLFLTVGLTSTIEIYKITTLFQLLALSNCLVSLLHSVYIDSLVFFILITIKTTAYIALLNLNKND